jgi:DNA-binding CsgD family transcriptional regulator
VPATRVRLAHRLLEREEELARVEAAIEAVAAGRGSLLLVEGPAGIGKSELLAAARARARTAGFEVLAASGGEFERSLGFGIVRELFAEPLREASPAEREALLAGAAALAAPALGFADPAPRDRAEAIASGDRAAAVQHGLHWLVANLAERAPLVLSVDDLHWGDPASARWLLYLARRLADLPALLIAAVRSGEPGLEPRLLAALEEEATELLRPESLSEAASAELVRARLGTDAADGFCAACHRVSGGNPFLLTELIDAVREDHVPPTADSVRRIDELGPEAISRSVLLRVARLPEGAEELTRAVAILGAEAAPRHAAALAQLDEDVAARAADALTEAGILAPGPPFRFVHPLIRAAVYHQIPAAERALAHRRAASLLADEAAAPQRVAAHLLASEPIGEPSAVDTLRLAAADAIERAAPQAAVAYLRRAFDEPPPSGIRPALLAELLEAAVLAADLSALRGISDDPLRELGADPAALTAAGPALAAWLFLNGRLQEVTDLFHRVVDAAVAAGQHAIALQAESMALSVVEVKPEEAVARLDAYADTLEAGSLEERTWLAMRGWWQHFRPGPASEGIALVRRALEGGSLLEAAPVAPVFGQAVLVLLRADELDEADRWIAVLEEDARRRGPVASTIAFGLRSWLAFRRGELASAEDDGRRAVELCREHGIGFGLAVNLRWLLDAQIERGELAEAEAELGASGLLGPLPDFYWFSPLRFGRARLRIAQGRTEEGIEELRELLRYDAATRPASDPVASTLALALHSLDGDENEVARLLEWELDAARAWGTPRGIGVALRAKGLVEGGEQGVELLREAVSTLSASPARLEHAHALADLGAAMRRARRRRDAREPLRKAAEIAHRCGARVIEERARAELAAAGARPRSVLRSGVEALTPSELRVARMAAAGLSNREIAQALFVTVKTVETHLGHVYRKLEVGSREQLPAVLVDERAEA